MSDVLERLRALEAEQAQLREARITELQNTIQTAQDELRQLGVEEEKRPRKRPQKRERDPNKPCSICGFATSPNHDARLKAHRDQEEKKPLTNNELKKLGMTKVAAPQEPAQ